MNTEPNSAAASLERELIRQIEGGLPLVPKPYAEVADRLGLEESEVIDLVKRLKQDGRIKRMGVIVRHWELGYHASAMVVWDIPDEIVDELGDRFGDMPFVTLCYRRPRRPPAWRYNLFTMIHGYDRDHVKNQVNQLEQLLPETGFPHEILFSLRRFKQRGARYGTGCDRRKPTAGSAVMHDSGERLT